MSVCERAAIVGLGLVGGSLARDLAARGVRVAAYDADAEHLVKAQEFYEKHGGKTIILARFMPILRTFAPVVAGVGRMEYRRFVYYNVFGGIGWVCSMLLIGYFLPPALDPLLQPMLGDDFQVQKHVEKVIIIVCVLSVLPALFAWLKHRLVKKRKAESTVALV